MVAALYRRYRPETFAEMIGQSQVTDPLRTALTTNRVNHAYLFSGPRGCGKTTSARVLARCLNCAEGPTDTPCGVCPSCRDLARDGGGSLDVVEIDAASHGGVDDARELRERAIFAPARDRYKIFIIDEAHMVTSGGFNALLKIVEEPPEHVKFVFATTEPEKVIGTIRSRTHHYPFRLIPPATMLDYVQSLCEKEGIEVDPGVLPLVVRGGGGSARDTLSLLDQLIAGSEGPRINYERAVSLLGFTHAALLDDTVDAIAAGDSAAAFHAVDKVIESGQDPRRFVEDVLERYRDLIVISATGSHASSVLRGLPQDELERMHGQAERYGHLALSQAADTVAHALGEMSGATSPRLQLELMIARLLVPSAAESLAPRVAPRAATGATDPGAVANQGSSGVPQPRSHSQGSPAAAPQPQGRADARPTSAPEPAPAPAGAGPVDWGVSTSGSSDSSSSAAGSPGAASPVPSSPVSASTPTQKPSKQSISSSAAGTTQANQATPTKAGDAWGEVPGEGAGAASDGAHEHDEPDAGAFDDGRAAVLGDDEPVDDRGSEVANTGTSTGQSSGASVGENRGGGDSDENPGRNEVGEPDHIRGRADNRDKGGPGESEAGKQSSNAGAESVPSQSAQTGNGGENAAVGRASGGRAADAENFTVEHARDAWPEVLQSIEKRKRSVWVLMEPTLPVAFENGVLSIGFTNEKDFRAFAADRTGDDSAVSITRTALTEVFGFTPRFKPAPMPNPRPMSSAAPNPESAGVGDSDADAEGEPGGQERQMPAAAPQGDRPSEQQLAGGRPVDRGAATASAASAAQPTSAQSANGAPQGNVRKSEQPSPDARPALVTSGTGWAVRPIPQDDEYETSATDDEAPGPGQSTLAASGPEAASAMTASSASAQHWPDEPATATDSSSAPAESGAGGGMTEWLPNDADAPDDDEYPAPPEDPGTEQSTGTVEGERPLRDTEQSASAAARASGSAAENEDAPAPAVAPGVPGVRAGAEASKIEQVEERVEASERKAEVTTPNRYGEAVVREVLGAKFLREEAIESSSGVSMEPGR